MLLLNQYRKKLEQKKGQRNQIEKDLKDINLRLEELKIDISNSEEAQLIIQAVAKITQQKLEYRITEPVSLAIASVYENPYKLSVSFDTPARGVTECDIGFEREGNIVSPLDSSGGGVIDVASFALRIAAWSLSHPRSRNIIILDEPMKFVQKNKISLAGEMIKEVSDKLGIQVIMVTHEESLIDCADKVFKVSINEGMSSVQEI
jgi:DNA repair exonuclease SbcCD ATPase subunit